MDKLIKAALLIGILYMGAQLLGFGGAIGAEMEALQARAKFEGKDKIVVLLTGTSWCPACQKLDSNVIQKPEWDTFIGSEAVFATYEYGASERPTTGPEGEMLERFNIKGFPTMIVMNRDGKVLGKVDGYSRGGLPYYKKWITGL